ncbi:MAG: helix-turn-helix domain-containing protein [Halalkalicoccus sp.]
MGIIAEVLFKEDVLLFEETFERVPEARCEFANVHYLTDGDDTRYVFFWWVSGCEFDAFEEALGNDPTVLGFREVTETGDGRLYRIVTAGFPPEQPLVFPLFREHDITWLGAVRDADGLHLRARFPDREALRTILDAGTEIARESKVTRLYSEERTVPDGCELTNRQREVLALAAREGYFETPSGVTLAEIADRLDISPQAVSKHVRAAVRKLVEREVASEPGI